MQYSFNIRIVFFFNIFYYPGSEKSSKLETLVITEFHCKYYYNITWRTWAGKAINIEYGKIDFENDIIETVTSTRL